MADKIRVELDFAKRLDIFGIFRDYMADMSDEIDNSIDISPNSPQIFTEVPMLKKKALINT